MPWKDDVELFDPNVPPGLILSYHVLSEKQMDTIELSSGVLIKCRALAKTEYEVLRDKIVSNPLSEYRTKYQIDVFVLADTEILVVENDYYTLYSSLADLDAVLQDAAEVGVGKEILFNKNFFGNTFPEKADSLVNELKNALQITSDPQDGYEFIVAIDDKIDGSEDPRDLEKKYFLNLIAALGQVLNKKHNGVWEMSLASDGVTYNPYLRIKNQRVEFFTFLYEDVYLTDQSKSGLVAEIYSTVGDIVKYHLKGM